MQILVVSPFSEDEEAIRLSLEEEHWGLAAVQSCDEARSLIRNHRQSLLVVCRDELPDGGWRDLIAELAVAGEKMELIVVSRCADEHLWAEVLNVGGFDLISTPLVPYEVQRVIRSALESAHGQQGPQLARPAKPCGIETGGAEQAIGARAGRR